jgi:uncharacterized protein (TIGR02145 family)
MPVKKIVKLAGAVIVAVVLGMGAAGGGGDGDGHGHFNPNADYGVFTDSRDGKKYRTVMIDDQIWMAENLNYNAPGSACYGEGDSVVVRYSRKNDRNIMAKLSDAEAQANCVEYGRLYDWNTAMTACPPGWRLPNPEDWERLKLATGADIAGKKLKSRSGWDGTDDFGFSALPGGRHDFPDNTDSYSDEFTFEQFRQLGSGGYWWHTAWGRQAVTMDKGEKFVGSFIGEMADCKYSVRCIEDKNASMPKAAPATASVKTQAVKSQDIGTFTDKRDGKKYATVKIGNTTWMAENLNHKIENSWCYRNKETNCDKSGRLYTWDAAKMACPAGWRLSDNKDWNNLAKVVGKQATAGGKLKSQTGWNLKADGTSGSGTDDIGFAALPGGRRYDWTGGVYRYSGSVAYWWSGTPGHYISGNSWSVNSRNDELDNSNASPSYGYSVRCVRNDK